jgi:hypothetical protein
MTETLDPLNSYERNAMRSRFTSVLATIAVVLLIPAFAAADCVVAPQGTTLRVKGDHFTVNGAPRFLVFVSYFDGVHRDAHSIVDGGQNLTTLTKDLCYFQAHGVNGIRVFPNGRSQDPPQG